MFLLRRDRGKNKGLRTQDLHSNMFLLRPVLTALTEITVLNLHSNMFLLRQKTAEGYIVYKTLFTFQYVSIKTYNCQL